MQIGWTTRFYALNVAQGSRKIPKLLSILVGGLRIELLYTTTNNTTKSNVKLVYGLFFPIYAGEFVYGLPWSWMASEKLYYSKSCPKPQDSNPTTLEFKDVTIANTPRRSLGPSGAFISIFFFSNKKGVNLFVKIYEFNMSKNLKESKHWLSHQPHTT